MENHYGKSPFFPDMSLWKITMFKTTSGKRLHNYGKSPFLMGKSTISMTIFNSKLNKLPKGSFRINTWPQQKPGHQSRGPSFQFQHHFYGAFCEILQVQGGRHEASELLQLLETSCPSEFQGSVGHALVSAMKVAGSRWLGLGPGCDPALKKP